MALRTVKDYKKARNNGVNGRVSQRPLPHSAPPANGFMYGPQSSNGPHLGPLVHPEPYYTQPNEHTSVKGRRSINCLLAGLVVLSFLATIILGVFVMVGCTTSRASLDSLYLTELTRNKTYDIKLRVGYFGGCVSIANVTGGASPIQGSDLAVNASADSSRTRCIMNMRGQDTDVLSDEFWEGLSLTTSALAEVKDLLNITLPQAKHLQDDVFFWPPPVLHFVLFFISGIMLFVGLASSSPKRRYGSVLVIASLIGAFALALSLVMAIASLQALNALVAGDISIKAKPLTKDIFIYRSDMLDRLQQSVVATTSIFYIVIGIAFIRRRPEGGNIFLAIFNGMTFIPRRGI